MLQIIQKVSSELAIKDHQVAKTVQLLFDEECTIPFIARYRKEMTGSLDEVQIMSIRDRFQYLKDLEDSRVKYLKVVEEHCKANPAYAGKFPELRKKFEAVQTRQELEDLYLPFKPKRRTRAQVAKEKGLEPLLDTIWNERASLGDLESVAQKYVSPADFSGEKSLLVADVKDALAGASDILAERINETADYRALVRKLSNDTGMLVSKKIESKAKAEDDKKKKKVDETKYENYFDFSESIGTVPGHRVMAIRRGEAEKVLRVHVEVDQDSIVEELKSQVWGTEVATDCVKVWVETAIDDAYKRLLSPSIETEIRLSLKSTAEEEAIKVFSKNLENLLLLPPIPGKVVMGVDPGLRTGSKLAVVDDTGKPLMTATIYPDYKKEDSPKSSEARDIVLKAIKDHNVTCIAIGNGTGSREIDRFITATTRAADIQDLKRVVVNEAGASVYSTDEIARDEFPDLDPTLRSAISIARRLQDPLAELVKINPRSIGVGQYQHDVNPHKLGKSLEEVVGSCVNKVGVNLNTASHKLLGYVSGVGPTLAKSIVESRNKNGKFASRQSLLEVSGFGPKAFQQAAGFVRVPDSPNPLDNSAVHPERYEIVESMVKDLNKEVAVIIGDAVSIDNIPLENYVTESVGLPTLHDIIKELKKPGRDPREDGARLMFSDEVSEIDDLNDGMKLKGTVTNVTNFGAFVDIGVHQDGLVHISELSNQFVKDPATVVSVGDILDVIVIGVDKARKRISLSCKQAQGGTPRPQAGASTNQGQRAENRNKSSGPARGKQSKVDSKQHSLNDLLSKFNNR